MRFTQLILDPVTEPFMEKHTPPGLARAAESNGPAINVHLNVPLQVSQLPPFQQQQMQPQQHLNFSVPFPQLRDLFLASYFLRGFYQPAGPLISAPGGPPPQPTSQSQPSSKSAPSKSSGASSPGPPAPSASTLAREDSASDSESNARLSTASPADAGPQPVASSSAAPPQPPPPPAPAYRYPPTYSGGPPHSPYYPAYPPYYSSPHGPQYPELCYSPYYHRSSSYSRRFAPGYYPTEAYASPSSAPPPIASGTPSVGSPGSNQMVVSDPTPPSGAGGPPPLDYSSQQGPGGPAGPPPGPLADPYGHYAAYPAPPGAPAQPPCYGHPPHPGHPPRGLALVDAGTYRCPCPMQSCPKNVVTGPLTGDTGKGPNQQLQQQSGLPLPLPPVALALPLEPPGALGPPSPARGSAGMHPPPSPATAATTHEFHAATWDNMESAKNVEFSVKVDPSVEQGGLLAISKLNRRKRERFVKNPSYISGEEGGDQVDEDQAKKEQDKSEAGGVKVESKDEDERGDKADTVLSKRVFCGIDVDPKYDIKFGPKIDPKCDPECDPKSEPQCDPKCAACNRKCDDADSKFVRDTSTLADIKKDCIESEVVTAGDAWEKSDKGDTVDECSDNNNWNNNNEAPQKRKAADLETDTQTKKNKSTTKRASTKKLAKSLANGTSKSKKGTNSAEMPEAAQKAMPKATPQGRKSRATSRGSESAPGSRKSSSSRALSTESNKSTASRSSSSTSAKRPNSESPKEGAKRRKSSSGSPVPSSGEVDEDEAAAVIAAAELNVPRDQCRKLIAAQKKLISKCQARKEREAARQAARQARKEAARLARINGETDQKGPKYVDPATVAELAARAGVRTPIQLNITEGELRLLSLCAQPKMPKYSNGWEWRGEPFIDRIFLNSDNSASLRKCYPSMQHLEGDTITPGDSILLKSGVRKIDLPFVARVTHLWENPDDGEMMVSLLWYYRPEHTDSGRKPEDREDEIFSSRHKDINSVACIEDKCYVLTYNEYCRYRKTIRRLEEGLSPPPLVVPAPDGGRYPRHHRQPPGHVAPDMVFFCRRIYDFRQRKSKKDKDPA